MKTPLLLLNFNRPHHTEGLINNLRLIRPSHIYFAIDGPRVGREDDVENCRLVENTLNFIDWPCDIKLSKNKTNLGLRRNVKLNLDWFFNENETGIILEDDIRFGTDFFKYCNHALENYHTDHRVGVISGNNLMSHLKDYPRKLDDSFLCRIFHCWGWATWRDCWALYDDSIELDDNFFEHQLPLILKSDPMSRYLGLKNGDIIKITRNSQSSGEYIVYRCCM